MKKSSFFLGGALLFATLFTTSCKEVLGSLDNPVSSYLTVNVADVTIPTGDTFQLKSETINSDNPITYKSIDETVATVDANGLVTGVADGETTILVSVAASQYYQEGTKEVKVAVKRPLTFEALEDGGISVYFYTVPEKPIVYSINGAATKQEITSYTWIPVVKGDKVEFESANERLTSGDWNWGVQIAPQSKCAVYGNVMSMITPDGNYHTNKTITQHSALYGLLYGSGNWEKNPNTGIWECKEPFTSTHEKYKLLLPATTLATACYACMLGNIDFSKSVPELPATELAPYCYQRMFSECYNLPNVPELKATDLKDGCYSYMFQYCTNLEKTPTLSVATMKDYCYQGMFYYCTSLKTAPALPATELKDYCYDNMFRKTGLTKAPALPATKLGEFCYRSMFYDCKDLAQAPALPATKMKYYSYAYMFSGCTALKEAPALPADELDEYCYISMFQNCTSLTKAPELKAAKLPAYCYYYMFHNCTKLASVKCLATEMTGYNAISGMLNNAGTDESVTKRTFTRSTDNNNWVNNDDWAWDLNQWYVPTSWTIDPAITAASAPARRAAAVKGTPIKTPTSIMSDGGEDTGGVKAPAKTNI